MAITGLFLFMSALFFLVDLSPVFSPAVGQNKGVTGAAKTDGQHFPLKETKADAVLNRIQCCLAQLSSFISTLTSHKLKKKTEKN